MRNRMREGAKTVSKKTTGTFLVVFFLLLLAVLIECFFCNFRHFESRRYRAIDLLTHPHSTLQGMVKQDGGYYVTAENPSIRFSRLDAPLSNLHLSGHALSRPPITFQLGFTDDGNAVPFFPAESVSLDSVPRTTYTRLFLSGNSPELTVAFLHSPGDTLTIDALALNTPVPFFFSFTRLTAFFLIGLLVFFLRPASSLHRLALCSPEHRGVKQGFLVLLLILQVLFFRQLTTSNSFWVRAERPYDNQYHRVTEAIAENSPSLLEVPPAWLQQMENPYDLGARMRLEEESGEIALWDHAFYNGKYYSYFGVLPALVYYLPVYLVTGAHAPNHFGVFAFLSAFALFSLLLLWEITKRYFSKTPYTVFVLLYLLFVNAPAITAAARRPDFYTVPIALSLFLSVSGLFCWISAKRQSGFSPLLLACGSLLLSLNALSRPQFLVTLGFAIPLFLLPLLRKEPDLSEPLGARAVTAFLLPIAAVAAIAMWYNAIRFSSPFDFGANYNLTSNDMTVRGLVPSRWPLGLFVYLFRPPVTDAVFPYLTPSLVTLSYQGTTIIEPTFGGLFWTGGFSLFSWLPLLCKTLFADQKKVRRLALFACTFAAVILLADIQMAGILQRYMADFSWLILLSSALSVLTLFDRFRGEGKRLLLLGFLVTALLSFLYALLLCYTDVLYGLANTDPYSFYHVSSLIRFLS